MTDSDPSASILDRFQKLSHELSIFMDGVATFLAAHPDLNVRGREVVHSYKKRIKDPEHLREKIARKRAAGYEINDENYFEKITDLSGVRIIHLFQSQFGEVDNIIREKVACGDWILHERPRAYTWDPETVDYFQQFDLDVEEKPTAYTSVHYVVRPRVGSPLSCEIQVRTLFEEIWGEVDHRLNYPIPTDNIGCREQLRVLSKLVGAGSRLLDSIERVGRAT